MTKHRALLWILITVLLAAVAIPAQAAAPPKEPAPKVGQKAGSITALLPVAHIVRGAGRAAVTSVAKKGDELIWNDLVKTERGGRARITLTDQSILSLGSQADLRIVRHDARSQQTALALGYGRLRAEVTKIARQGGSFELRTPTAVAGVIGTDFGTDASTVGSTTFLCISGIVQVANADPSIAGSVQCAPGMTTTVAAGKAPNIPTNATPEQIQQLIQDTEPAIISAMSPMSSLPGVTVDATITGAKLTGIKKADISGGGVVASLVGTPTDTAVTVHLVINPNAAPGPRTITLSKQSGAASAAVFSILAPPTPPQPGVAAGIDPKKPYHDLFAQEAGSAKAGLSAFVAGAQQAADQAQQQLQSANQGNLVDLRQAVNNLTAEVAKVQKAVDDAAPQIDAAATTAASAFDGQYETAHNALLQRNADGTPDDAFNKAVQDAFNQVNATLGSNLNGIRGAVASAAQTATGNVGQIQANWTSAISTAVQNLQQPPTPAVNNIERSIDLGAVFGGGAIAALDASNSKASSGASIAGYKWVLCDSSYKPAQFGVPIAAAASGCNPVSGYTSSSSDFSFATCSLNPADYIARVTVTDSNNQSAALDVKVHVLAPTYDDPATRLINLGAAYSTLSVTQFLSFFDQTNFAGFTSLQENVRNTFPLLASMNINPQISQSSISCNDATVRADWVQNYAYKPVCTANPANPSEIKCVGGADLVFKQSEQLSVRMTRAPGKGWFITDFQGDNGKVQGQLPGPSFTDNPQPDLEARGVFPTYAGQPNAISIPVPPGAQSFSAIVTNVGGADLTAATSVRFTLQDATGAPINGSMDVPLSLPMKAGESQTVSATLTVPPSVGMPFTAVANVNPGCSVTEAHCDANNVGTSSLFVGTPVKLALLNTSPLAFIAGGATQTLQVSVSDAASISVALPTGFTTTSANPQAIPAGGGTATWVLAATYNAPPSANLTMTVTAVASGISVPLSVPYSVTGPTMTPTTAPTLLTNGLAQTLSVAVSQPGTYTLTVPPGITAGPSAAQTVAAAGTINWSLSADFTVAEAAFTSAASNIKVSPGGVYSINVPYSVTGPKMGVSATPSYWLAGGAPGMLSIVTNSPGNYTITVPAGFHICADSQCLAPGNATQSAVGSVGPYYLQWYLQADLTAVSGTFSSAASALKVSPGGVYTLVVPYSVVGPTFTQAVAPTLVAGGATQPLSVSVNVPGTYTLSPPAGITAVGCASYPCAQTITGSTGGALVWDIQASPTAPTGGPFTATIAAGVHTFLASFIVSPPGAPALSALVLTAGGGSQVLTADFTSGGTFTLQGATGPTLPTGISLDPEFSTTYPATQTVLSPTGGTLTWHLMADYTAATGNLTNMSISNGTVSWPVPYTVNGEANYIISNVVIKDSAGGVHNQPFTGADAFQMGESFTETITIQNIGNASPTGQITIAGGCSDTDCGSQQTAIVDAPPVGLPVDAVISLAIDGSMVPGPHTGIFSLTTAIPQNTADDSSTASFDVVDFSLAVNYANYPSGFIPSDPQNFLVGAPQRVEVKLSELSSVPFSIPLTIGPANPNLSFAPPSASISPGTLAFAATSTTAMPTGPYTVTVTGTNHGVTRTVDQAMNFMTADLQFANLYLNDAGNPLKIQVGNTTPQIVSLTLSATSFIGSISLTPSTSPYFTQYISGEGNSYEWDITATSAAPTVQGVNAAGQIPNSYPETTIYKPLYVTTIGVPDLQVLSITPARSISSGTPWLSGEAIDFQVVVHNNSTAGKASDGGEQVTLGLDYYPIGAATVPIALAPGAQTTVTVHAIAPDYGTLGAPPSPVLAAKVAADSAGDMNYYDNTCQGIGTCVPSTGAPSLAPGSVVMSNWRIAVSGPGVSDGNPVSIPVSSVPPFPGSATVVGTVDNDGSTALTFYPVAGVYSAKMSAPTFGACSLAACTVNLAITDATARTDVYMAQVVVQLKDPATGAVTAQRQATIHVSATQTVQNYPFYAAEVSCLYKGNHCDPFNGPQTTIQLNGPVAENYTVQITTPGCVPNTTTPPYYDCTGTADLSVTDAFNTSSSPLQMKSLSFNGTPVAVQVAAAIDSSGEIITGLAPNYSISLTAAQYNTKRGISQPSPSPDPAGQSVQILIQVGDIDLNATSAMSAGGCVSVPPGGPAVPLTATWDTMGGFNADISWQLTGGGSSAINLTGNYSGSATFSSGYTSLNGSITASQAVDTLIQYVMQVTISNGISSATKYFPLYVDASAAQNLCGATMGARGYTSQRIKGAWRRSAIGTGPAALSSVRTAASATGAKPDLRLSASDISFLPSVPKLGDAVQVRFRVRNEGDANAVGVPIALQINGATVAMDSFDVAAGRTTLGGLQWNGVLPAGVAPRAGITRRPATAARGRMDGDAVISARRPIDVDVADAEPPAALTAMLVIDPQHTTQQKTTLEKAAALAHFTLRSGSTALGATAPAAGSQRILLELAEGTCAGLRLTTGSFGPCGSADVEINLDEKNGLSLNTMTGVADLGDSFSPLRLGSARYVSQTVVLAGRSYAVQLGSDRTAVLSVVSVRDPGQLDAKARALFRASAVRILGQLGGNTAGPAGPGDVAGTAGPQRTVFIELGLQTN